ncbi:Crp/Fnr family transcriptional regulator [Clostridium sp. AN503]|uniref:Crp/Fnr family transcriptional regulator n=1 Tax=Clostridium sp. AN503 TaxID=3160598 RepID=UPI003459897E
MYTWDKSSLTLPSPVQKELEELIRLHSEVITYNARKIFLEPGDIMNGVYYVAEGRTRHYMVSMDGTEKILYTLAAGWFYGETPCSLSEPTGLYSSTETKTTLYCIPLREYDRLIGENKLFRDAILHSYSKKLLILRHEVENLAFNSCKDRLKRLFCSVADTEQEIDNGWFQLKIHYTQYELSTIVGGARVTVSKLINELCDEGFIRILNRNIQISVKEYYKFIKWMEEHRY